MTTVNDSRDKVMLRVASYPDLELEQFEQAILGRRSARVFKKGFIQAWELLQILDCLSLDLPAQNREDLELYVVVNRVAGLAAGVYKNLRLLKEGDFSEKVGYLCINQAVVRDSAVTFFWTGNYRNYQNAVQLAGWLGQKVYLMSRYLEIGCSGIGAYYDDETQEFLGTNQDILYAMVIGQ